MRKARIWRARLSSNGPSTPRAASGRCSAARLAAVEAESEGRRVALMQKAEEARSEWLRAEAAESRLARVREVQRWDVSAPDAGVVNCTAAEAGRIMLAADVRAALGEG